MIPHPAYMCMCMCVSESLKWLLCQQHGNLKITHTYVWIFLSFFMFLPLFLQPTQYCGTGGPTWWYLLEATALTTPSGARLWSLSASSKACECWCLRMCVFLPPSIRKLEPLLLINLTCPHIHLSPLLLRLYTLHSIIYLTLSPVNSASCRLLLFMYISSLLSLFLSSCPPSFHGHFLTLSIAVPHISVSPLPPFLCFICPSTIFPLLLNSFLPSLLQSNPQSVVAQERRRAVWNSDHQRNVWPPPALQ